MKFFFPQYNNFKDNRNPLGKKKNSPPLKGTPNEPNNWPKVQLKKQIPQKKNNFEKKIRNCKDPKKFFKAKPPSLSLYFFSPPFFEKRKVIFY